MSFNDNFFGTKMIGKPVVNTFSSDILNPFKTDTSKGLDFSNNDFGVNTDLTGFGTGNDIYKNWDFGVNIPTIKDPLNDKKIATKKESFFNKITTKQILTYGGIGLGVLVVGVLLLSGKKKPKASASSKKSTPKRKPKTAMRGTSNKTIHITI